MLTARSRLVGNGLVPLFTFDDDGERTPDLGSGRRTAVYTHPDLTRNRLLQGSLSWRQALNERTTAEALLYVRDSRRETINGDEAQAAEEEEEADDRHVAPQANRSLGPGHARAPAVHPGAENASFNRTATRQRGAGLSAALSGQTGAHRRQVGASFDRARVRYEQTEQEGYFDDTRGVLPGDEAPEVSAAVTGTSSTMGIYITDTWRVAATTHVTSTLRFNQSRVSNQITSVDDDSGELEAKANERFRYRSLNPALGIAHRVGGGVTVFANVARNTRVPTVIELGCADPEEPCRLPAGLQADPYLKQVRNRLRGWFALRLGSHGRAERLSHAAPHRQP